MRMSQIRKGAAFLHHMLSRSQELRRKGRRHFSDSFNLSQASAEMTEKALMLLPMGTSSQERDARHV